MEKRYPAVAHKDPASDWGLSFVDLPINLIGKDLEKLIAECQEAFEEFMADESELPKPSSLDEVAASEEAEDGVLVMVDIDTSFFEDPSERRSMSARRSQWDAIDKAAKKAGQTRSAFMVAASLEKAAA